MFVRFLRDLLGGIRRFLPRDMGGNRRLRHLGSQGSGPGLTSSPGENSSRAMLDELLSVLGNPLHSGDALLSPLLKYCKRRFGNGVPSVGYPWRGWQAGQCLVAGDSGRCVTWLEELEGVGWKEAGGCWKRVWLTWKTPSSGFPKGFKSAKAVPRRWKTLSCRADEDSTVKKGRHLEPDEVGVG